MNYVLGVPLHKQWILRSLKHETVLRVNNLYCFYVKNPQYVLHYGAVQVMNTYIQHTQTLIGVFCLNKESVYAAYA